MRRKREPGRITVIGAGISGLAAAYELTLRNRNARRPLEIEVLERAPAVGGKIASLRENGVLVEGGPDCFIQEKPWALQLVRELGMENELLNTSPETSGTFVFVNRTLHRLPEGVMMMVPTRPGPFLKSKLFTWPGKLRMAAEVLVPRRRSDGDETLASFVRRRLGNEALEKLAEPLIAGIHAGDPDNMSLLSTFPRFLELEREYGSLILGLLQRQRQMRRRMKKSPPARGPRRTFFITLKNGLISLPEKLVEVIGPERIHTGESVIALQPTATGRWRIIRPEQRISYSDAVIVTTEAYNAATMFEPEMAWLADLLKGIPYVSSATVSLLYPRRVIPHPLDAYGFIVPRSANRRIMAVTWSSIKWAGRAPAGMVLLRVFVGGAKQPELTGLGEQMMTNLVREELEITMGITAPPRARWIFRWPQGMPQYIIGHPDRLKALAQTVASTPGLFLAGAAYRGIGIPDCINQGRQAAARAWELLQR